MLTKQPLSQFYGSKLNIDSLNSIFDLSREIITVGFTFHEEWQTCPTDVGLLLIRAALFNELVFSRDIHKSGPYNSHPAAEGNAVCTVAQ